MSLGSWAVLASESSFINYMRQSMSHGQNNAWYITHALEAYARQQQHFLLGDVSLLKPEAVGLRSSVPKKQPCLLED